MRVVEIAYNMNMSKTELRQVLKSDTYDEISFIAKEVKMSKSEVIQEIKSIVSSCYKLAEQIKTDFGSFDKLKDEISAKAAGRFGSGWAWLVVKEDGHLKVVSSPNQDNPFMCGCSCNATPILGLDVWEHAYYLKYKNVRADYIKAFFNVVDWNIVGKKFEEAGK